VYIPSAFREDRKERLAELMRDHPLATLVTMGGSGLIASHVPLIYESLPDSPGILRGHLSRANQQAQDFRSDVEALAIFQGPQAYISPSWYATKPQHGRVVPTWNYVTVHAYGKLEAYTEPSRLRKHLEALTAEHEKSYSPWTLHDAPPEFIAGLLNAIVGIEIRLTRLEGKWKVSQNRPAEDRSGVIAGLTGRDDPESRTMADLVREWSPKE
jgi:transcriptional regulator